MSLVGLFGISALYLATLIAAVAVGSGVIRLLRRLLRRQPPAPDDGATLAEGLGVPLMVGIGTFGWLATWLGFLGAFSRWTLTPVFLAAVALSLAPLRDLARRLGAAASGWWRHRTVDPVMAVLVVSAVVLTGTLYLAALQPPYASDELHYHLPQARALVDTGRLTLPLGGHPYYGNIPKLMEVVFAWGIAIGGYSYAHALHLAVVIGLVLFLGGFLARHYGARTAGVAVLLVLGYREFTWNATVAFVDAASASFEVAALLLALDWLVGGRGQAAPESAALLGLAVGVKYSPLPTALFIAAAIVIVAIRTRAPMARPALAYVLIAIAFGGFWYVRNLIEFANPVYPFYFGHAGITDEAYRALLADLHQYGDRTVKHFLGTPWRFYAGGDVVPGAAMLLAPFSLVVRRSRSLLAWLVAFATLYAVYWFFLASHQTRFVMPAVLVALLLAAVLVERLWLLFVSLAVVAALGNHVYGRRGELRYALGRQTREEFLTQRFGCQYQVIAFLEAKHLSGTVIDNWSVWHAPSVSFFARSNVFQRFSQPPGDSLTLGDVLRRGDIRYVYLDTAVKARHLASQDPEIARGRAERAAVEGFILRAADPIFASDGCRLYQIDLRRLGSVPARGSGLPTP